MRVLLDASSEVAERTAHVLLSEEDVSFLGLWKRPDAARKARSGPADDVNGFNVVVTDRSDHLGELVARCSVAGVPLVLWADAEEVAPGSSTAPVVKGANVGSALAEVLAFHPSAAPSHTDTVSIGWTEPGSPLQSGHAMPFPDPVGLSWTEERTSDHFVAYREDEWGGATVSIEGPAGSRIVGISDLAAHLEAVVLAAAALVAVDGGYEPGIQMARDAGRALLDKLLYLELDFAVWSSAG